VLFRKNEEISVAGDVVLMHWCFVLYIGWAEIKGGCLLYEWLSASP